MFETAELNQKIGKKEYKDREPVLRQQLLEAQGQLLESDFPVIVLFGGVDGGGKSEMANLLNEWMDPRRIVTHAFGPPSQEETERPEFWRYWRELPPKGHMGVFLSAWYSQPLLDRVHGKVDSAGYDERLEEIVKFERMLADDGALILKFWLHLGKDAQQKRFKALERDPLQKWRVTKRDWAHWRIYDRFVSASERLIMRTSTGDAPWRIVEGADEQFRSLEVGNRLLAGIQRRLNRVPPSMPAIDSSLQSDPYTVVGQTTVLSRLDMTKALNKGDYRRALVKYQGRLNRLYRETKDRKLSTILVFQGWDAAGKGGAIRRVTAALDARDYKVISVAAPTDEERAQHYLWRFWRHLPRAGRVTLYDRSWYGRVLVERVEGFARPDEWRRAYAEINEFENQLVEHGSLVIKFWVHISKEEQEARFEARQNTPHKRWKLNDEDWRNREKWASYEVAVNDMIERTSTQIAPWILVEGNDKRYARIRVLRSVCEALQKRLERSDGPSHKRKKKNG